MMKNFHKGFCVVLLICASTLLQQVNAQTTDAARRPSTSSNQRTKPTVVILATGGMIATSTGSATDMANYVGQPAAVTALMTAVPQIHDLATVRAEQVANVLSNVITSETVLTLAKRVNTLLDDPQVSGIVVTHGTDTMEETAYFLSLTTRSDKPVVITGAMRPAGTISADGPLNLLDAVLVASSPASWRRGVMVVMNNRISAARYVTKLNTLNPSTMGSLEQGYLGVVAGERPVYFYEPAKVSGDAFFDVRDVTSLPRVELIYRYQGQQMQLALEAINQGAKGLVIAFTGNGSAGEEHERMIREMGTRGIPVVRASRVNSGVVTPKTSGSMASGLLSPQKARVFLMLALTETSDLNRISAMFAGQ